MFKKKFVGDLAYAFVSQIVSLLLSIVLSLLVPKLLGLKSFSYWQLFIFYTNYLMFLHLGLNDGIYLKYGGTRFKDLDLASIKSQFILGYGYELIFVLLLISGNVIFLKDNNRLFVVVLSSVYFLIATAGDFLGNVLQATLNTRKFSISLLISRIVFIGFIIVGFVTRQNKFEYYVMMYSIAMVIAVGYCMFECRQLLTTKMLPFKRTIRDTKDSIFVGSKLMVSNIASMLILGVSRFMVDKNWGIIYFGELSFAISITNFFLVFIKQISMVLFPTLRTLNKKDLRKIYHNAKTSLEIILPSILIMYFPIYKLLELWLPQYHKSLLYLGFLLPLCLFDGKMQMLFNTYLKVLRMERQLMKINVISVIVSIAFCSASIFILNNFYLALISLDVVIAFRSIYAELSVNRIFEIKPDSFLFLELSFSSVFIILLFAPNQLLSFLIYFVLYLVFLIVSHGKLIQVVTELRLL